jgi:hypothetical protein
MDKYGIDNVRGGSYTTIVLNDSTRQHLTKISHSTNNRCFTCGQAGHFSGKCPAVCSRCKRNHSTANCYATLDIKGNYIQDCLRCGRNHPTIACFAKTNIRGEKLETQRQKERQLEAQKEFELQIQRQTEQIELMRSRNQCSRCGKIGHYRTECYETKDINGKPTDDYCVIS